MIMDGRESQATRLFARYMMIERHLFLPFEFPRFRPSVRLSTVASGNYFLLTYVSISILRLGLLKAFWIVASLEI